MIFGQETTEEQRIESLKGTIDIDNNNEPAPENIPDARDINALSCLQNK